MKKLFLLLAAVVMGVALWSCSSDDSDEPVAYDSLPTSAKAFLETYYKGANIISLYKETDNKVVTYEVVLGNGSKVDFDGAGHWSSVEAAKGLLIPKGIAPEQIERIVNERAPMFGINAISIEKYGYEVDVTNGLEMKFDHNYNLIGNYDW